jgi:hypothetical protein
MEFPSYYSPSLTKLVAEDCIHCESFVAFDHIETSLERPSFIKTEILTVYSVAMPQS